MQWREEQLWLHFGHLSVDQREQVDLSEESPVVGYDAWKAAGRE